MVHFEQISIVRIEVGNGKVDKESGVNYWDSIIWKDLGQTPGESVLVSPPLLRPE